MLRSLLAFFVLVHGLIHLIGFVKAFQLADITHLTQHISKPTGILWLFTAALFVVSAALLFWKKEVWWIPCAFALALSQTLIIMSWSDARIGTIANLIILLPTVVGYGVWNFNSMVTNELKTFLPHGVGERKVVTEDMIAPLPQVVQKWLRRSNIIGKEIIQTVHLHQTGEMRTSPDGKRMHVEAEQYNTVEKVGFIWLANVELMAIFHLAGRDKYEHGKGHMLIKLLSLFPIANAKGPTIDQGALVRYMAEIVWFPTAALSDYISWEEVDPTKTKATMSHGGVTASVIFTFTSEGDVKTLEAMRYYDRKEGPTLEKWYVRAEPEGFRTFQGIRIPAKSIVSWKLKEGDFTWYKLEITAIDYNKNFRKTASIK